MPLYSDILKQAARITWRHKYLWLFGILATAVGGTIETQLIYAGFGEPNNFWLNWRQFLAAGPANGINWQVFSNLRQALWSAPGSVALMLLIALIIVALYLLFLAVASWAQAALVNNTALMIKYQSTTVAQSDDGVSALQPGLKLGLSAGRQYLWPVFGLNAGFKFLAGLIFYVVSVTFLLAYHPSLVAFLAGGALFIVLAAGLALLALLTRYAIGFLILEKQKFWPAVLNAWRLFVANWLVSVEMSFILFFSQLLGSAVIILAVVSSTIPVLIVLNLFWAWQWSAAVLWLFFLMMILFYALLVWGYAVLAVFQISIWTGLFLRLREGTAQSKILRVFSGKM